MKSFDQIIFGKKTFSDLLKEIHTNQVEKKKKITELIQNLSPLINSPGDAVMLVPMIKEYLDVGVKNDEHLIKLGMIVQRLMQDNNNKGDFELTDEEKQALLETVKDINKEMIDIDKEIKKYCDELGIDTPF